MSTQVTVKITVDDLDKIRRVLKDYERKLLVNRDGFMESLKKHPNDLILRDTVKKIDHDLFAVARLTQVFS